MIAQTVRSVGYISRLGGVFVGGYLRMSNDFVFDALEVFEEQRVIARRCVFWIFAGRRDDDSANDLQLSVKSIDFGPRPRSEGKMVECPGFSSMNCFIPEDPSRRRDGEGHPWMAVLDNVEFVRVYDRAYFALGAEAEKRKELVVEGNSNRHISNCYLNMIDYRLHSPSSSFGRGNLGSGFKRLASNNRNGKSAYIVIEAPRRKARENVVCP